MKVGWILFYTWLCGGITGNFAYQYLNDGVWASAIERSYFQGFIILLAYYFIRILGERKDE